MVLAVWLEMLCHAGSRPNAKRGTLAGWRDDIVACELDVEEGAVLAVRSAMEGLLLSKNSLLGWDSRQSDSGSSTERVRALQARKRAAAVTVSVTPETHTSRPETREEKRGEENREEESNPAPSVRGGAAESPPTARPQKRSARIPDDWETNQALLDFAAGLGLDGITLADEFRDYWRAENGAKAEKRDWDAAFRTWCRNEVKRRPPGGELLLPLLGVRKTMWDRKLETIAEHMRIDKEAGGPTELPGDRLARERREREDAAMRTN